MPGAKNNMGAKKCTCFVIKKLMQALLLCIGYGTGGNKMRTNTSTFATGGAPSSNAICHPPTLRHEEPASLTHLHSPRAPTLMPAFCSTRLQHSLDDSQARLPLERPSLPIHRHSSLYTPYCHTSNRPICTPSRSRLGTPVSAVYIPAPTTQC